ncbi:MAG: hypothetical protein AAGD96_09965 [Chloroflexota bacterium]
MKRSWIWILAVLLLIGGVATFWVINNLSVPEADYDVLDPAIIQIGQGTEGEIADLEIGLLYVDAESAGVLLANVESGGTENVTLLIGQQADVLGHSITLIDVILGPETAVFRVLPAP